MFKKVLVVAVIAAVGVFALRATKIGSHVRTGVAEVREWAESQIPPEAEIKRLRGEVKALEQDLLKAVDALATENVRVRDLRQKTAEYRAGVEQDQRLLVARATEIKKATETVSYGDEVLSVKAATRRLNADFATLESRQKSLEAMDANLAARERNRKALEDQLNTLKTQRQEMTAAVDRLEAELNILKVQQIESKYQTDDTRLAKIKDSIREMQQKIDVQREALRLTPTVREKDAGAVPAGKSVDEILQKLNGGPKAEKKITNAD